MFLPLYDNNSLKRIPFQFVTLGLIAVNVALFLVKINGMDHTAIASFAVVPTDLIAVKYVGGPAMGPLDRFAIPEWATLVTYMFFHFDVFHLIGNMLFLWVFGDNVEDALGHFRFLVFYLLCGIAGALTHTAVSSESGTPLIGASAGVAGVIAAYLMLHPRVHVWVLVMRIIPLKITAAFALGFWVLMQIAMVLVPQVGPVAWWAHIGGLVAGALLVIIMRRPGVPLFDRGLAKPPATVSD
ncbi:MAG: rhomboid family intramembrane serine protease [Hyphomicrobiaceae bacterium]